MESRKMMINQEVFELLKACDKHDLLNLELLSQALFEFLERKLINDRELSVEDYTEEALEQMDKLMSEVCSLQYKYL